ncbi:Uncharacterised protein [Bordetella pertussis]|nr:Uncharacterised protein [Bordetella pertussis]
MLGNRLLAGRLDHQVGTPGQQAGQAVEQGDAPGQRGRQVRRVARQRGQLARLRGVGQQAGGHVRGDGAQADECNAMRHRE